MNESWYKLEFTPIEYVKSAGITKLESTVKLLLNDPIFGVDIMVLTSDVFDVKRTVWIFPPRTVKLMPQTTLTNSGAELCPAPDINELSVLFGNELDKDAFFENIKKS